MKPPCILKGRPASAMREWLYDLPTSLYHHLKVPAPTPLVQLSMGSTAQLLKLRYVGTRACGTTTLEVQERQKVHHPTIVRVVKRKSKLRDFGGKIMKLIPTM